MRANFESDSILSPNSRPPSNDIAATKALHPQLFKNEFKRRLTVITEKKDCKDFEFKGLSKQSRKNSVMLAKNSIVNGDLDNLAVPDRNSGFNDQVKGQILTD